MESALRRMTITQMSSKSVTQALRDYFFKAVTPNLPKAN